jgi:polyhydroxyalkanoate synthesis regulator phasin
MNLSFTKALSAAGKGLPEEALQTGILYRAAILASAQVRFLDRRYSLDMQQVKSALVSAPDAHTIVRWDDYVRTVPDEKGMDPAPDPQAHFAALNGPASDAHLLGALQKDFVDWVYRKSKVSVRANTALGVFATPEVSHADFMKACADAARDARNADQNKATGTLDRQIASLQDKLARAERDYQQNQTQFEDRKREEVVSDAETVFSLLGGKRSRRISSTISKHRITEQTKAQVTDAADAVAEFKQQLAQLQQSRQQALDMAGTKWGNAVNNITEIPILPKKTDIYVSLFGVAWMPYYLTKSGDQVVEIPAFA